MYYGYTAEESMDQMIWYMEYASKYSWWKNRWNKLIMIWQLLGLSNAFDGIHFSILTSMFEIFKNQLKFFWYVP